MNYEKSGKFYFTVGQLSEALKTFAPDLPVLVSGYENGYENFFEPFVKKLKHLPENSYYEGEFQPAEDGEKEVFEAVVLGRVERDD
jgi:hypothetical protein